MKPRGLARDPLARANEALGLDDVAPPPSPASLTSVAAPPAPSRPAEPAEVTFEAPEAPHPARRASKARTGTYGNPYERRDGAKMVKLSLNVSLDFYQELRRFEAELPPKGRNAWMEKALRSAIARTQKRWEKARERRAAGLPPEVGDEDDE